MLNDPITQNQRDGNNITLLTCFTFHDKQVYTNRLYQFNLQKLTARHRLSPI